MKRFQGGSGMRKGGGGHGLLLATLAVAAGLLASASPAVALSPSVGTKAASNVDYSTATLNGTVNPNGLETKAYFEYGPTVAYGSKTAEVSVGAGSSAVEIAKAVTGLTPNTTYHFRVVASNVDGTSNGGDKTFTVGWKAQTAPAGTQMKDVSCSSPSACTAVKDGTIQRWNGSEWKSQTVAVPVGGSGVSIQAVSCPSDSACTAVGSYSTGSETKTLAESWNGTEWKVLATLASVGTIQSLSCSSTSECTAVGHSGTKSFALRGKGSEWASQTVVNPGEETYLTSVSCVSSSFCMATGFYREAPSTWVPLAERWNGTEWSTKAPVKPAGATHSWLNGVSCTSSTACTAVGTKEVNAGTHENQTMAQRWNGTEWTLQTTPNPEASTRNVEDVSCASSTSCTAVGYLTSEVFFPFSMKWDGSTWVAQNLPLPSGGTKAMVFAVSCIDLRGCEAVGQYWNASSTIVPLAEANWRAAMPTVATTAATGVGEKSATINGTANPNSSETKVYFEYGTTTSYGSKTAEFNVGLGTSVVEQGAALTGLSPATTYHYRIVGNNENPGTSRGADQTFRTTGPPTVSTFSPELDSSGEAATLRGQVNPNGLSTTYQFEYGTTSGVYTKTTPVESAGSGTEPKIVTYKVTGLTKGTKYFYRLSASSSAKVDGNEVNFTTPSAPAATTGSATEVTRKCATLKGTVEPHGLVTKYWFEYGTTTSYGTKIPVIAKELGGAETPISVQETACGLSSNTLYHFRLVAENGLGSANGSDLTFTTIPAVTLSVKGTPLGAKAPLKAFSSNFTFKNTGGGMHTCVETEFAGEVTENPGALQSIATARIQGSGGAGCPIQEFYTVKYSIPTKGMTLEYTSNKISGVAKLTKFTLIGSIYAGLLQLAECEYTLELTGTYTLGATLGLTLTGETDLIKSTGTCLPDESVTGTFAVTSSGSAVEAK